MPRVDPIPSWRSWGRKLVTFRTISERGRSGLITPDDYLSGMASLQGGAARNPDLFQKTEAFWKMENLTYSYLKNSPAGSSLRDERLPVEARPIAHCGMGAGAVELGEFDSKRMGEVIDSFSRPEYRLLAYETIGAMYSVYERDAFGFATRAFDKIGFVKLAPLRAPVAAALLDGFDPKIQRLISHGYGRMLYFKSSSIGGAARAAARTPGFDLEAQVQGIAFAYAMVNSADVGAVLGAGNGLGNPSLVRAFRRGLTYALMFWEWMSPGAIDLIEGSMKNESALIAVARRETGKDREKEILRPFGVGDPDL